MITFIVNLQIKQMNQPNFALLISSRPGRSDSQLGTLHLAHRGPLSRYHGHRPSRHHPNAHLLGLDPRTRENNIRAEELNDDTDRCDGISDRSYYECIGNYAQDLPYLKCFQ